MTDLSFDFAHPVSVLFGPGRLNELGGAVASHGRRALLVVGEEHAVSAGLVDEVVATLRESGVDSTLFGGVHPNPQLEIVTAGTAVGRAADVDVVVGVGGGSVMDTAKAISLALTHEGDVWEYRIEGSFSVPGIHKVLPVVTVPTTAGSASEVSPAALITHNGKKEVLVSPNMFPVVALIDPELTRTLPSRVTAVSGFDCLVQAIEPLVASNSNLLSDAYARQALMLVASSLREAVADGNDIQARSRMSLASILGGFAISQSGVGAIHALGAPLTAHYGLAHGASLVPLALPVLRFNEAAAKAEYAWAAGVLSGDSGEALTLVIEALLAEIHLEDLLSYSPPRSDLEQLVVDAQNPDMGTNPVPMTPDDIRRIYMSLGE